MAKSTHNYEKGTTKVVWIEEDMDKIYSKMYDNEQDAVAFARKKEDYIIFSMIHQKDMEEFSWKLLPYGRYELYTTLLQNYKKHKGNIMKIFKYFK